jgi:hypothetical protein
MRIAPPLLALLLFCSTFALVASGCSSDCIADPVDDDDDGSYVDPFAGWQDIEFESDIVEVNDVPFGGSEIIEVVLRNVGDADLEIDDFSWDTWSDDNWNIDPDTVPDDLGPGQQAVLEIVFVNTDAQDTYASLDIFSNDPDEERASVAFIGRADAGRPDARIDPVVLDFGFVWAGNSVTRGVELSNVGDRPLQITAIGLTQSGDVFSLVTPEADLVDAVIEPGDAEEILFRLQPSNLTTASAQFVIQTNDPQRPELTLQIRGNGDGALGCTPPSIVLDAPTSPLAIQTGTGAQLEASFTVDDDEQPANPLLVELFIGDQLIEDEDSLAGGATHFIIDIDDFSIEDVLDEFPRGLHTFSVKVTDGCPLSAWTQFVGVVDETGELDPTDSDGDGYGVGDGDCNDADVQTFPGAIELLDGEDNDCDLVIDEKTEAWDDDCDGYCEAPPCLGQGPAVRGLDTCDGLAADQADFADCDDRTDDFDGDQISDGAAFSPAAEETSNHLDDDCDGVRDDGTGFADDDGDGFNDVGGDCDDDDPTIFAGAIEWCDGKDNDCAGGVDDDCLEEVRSPQVVGDIRTNRFQIPLGIEVEAQAVILSDDEALTYVWTTDKGSFVGESNGPTATWIAPADTPSNEALIGTFANLQVTITDSAGRSANGFGVLLFAEATTGPAFSPVGQNCGCAIGDSPGSRPLTWNLLILLTLLIGRTGRKHTRPGRRGAR